MQAIVAAGFVMQKERRGLALSGVMALRGEAGKLPGKAGRVAQRFHPAIGDGGQRRVGVLAQVTHDIGQRVMEILIIAHAEPVARHFDAAAKQLRLGIERDQAGAFRRCQDRRQLGVARAPQRVFDFVPGEMIECHV